MITATPTRRRTPSHHTEDRASKQHRKINETLNQKARDPEFRRLLAFLAVTLEIPPFNPAILSIPVPTKPLQSRLRRTIRRDWLLGAEDPHDRDRVKDAEAPPCQDPQPEERPVEILAGAQDGCTQPSS